MRPLIVTPRLCLCLRGRRQRQRCHQRRRDARTTDAIAVADTSSAAAGFITARSRKGGRRCVGGAGQRACGTGGRGTGKEHMQQVGTWQGTLLHLLSSVGREGGEEGGQAAQPTKPQLASSAAPPTVMPHSPPPIPCHPALPSRLPRRPTAGSAMHHAPGVARATRDAGEPAVRPHQGQARGTATRGWLAAHPPTQPPT